MLGYTPGRGHHRLQVHRAPNNVSNQNALGEVAMLRLKTVLVSSTLAILTAAENPLRDGVRAPLSMTALACVLLHDLTATGLGRLGRNKGAVVVA